MGRKQSVEGSRNKKLLVSYLNINLFSYEKCAVSDTLARILCLCVTIFQFQTPPSGCCHFANSSAVSHCVVTNFKGFDLIDIGNHYTNNGQSVNQGK